MSKKEKQHLPSYHLDQTVRLIKGLSKAQIVVFNQWAATAFDKYHKDSSAEMELVIDNEITNIILNWNSKFSKDGMRERKKIAEEGAIALAIFIMSAFKDYRYVLQTEIGEGVDYRFQKETPSTDNFLLDSHYIEISGILEESKGNTLKDRINVKHKQIEKGTHNLDMCSVIITLFNKPVSVKEIHK